MSSAEQLLGNQAEILAIQTLGLQLPEAPTTVISGEAYSIVADIDRLTRAAKFVNRVIMKRGYAPVTELSVLSRPVTSCRSEVHQPPDGLYNNRSIDRPGYRGKSIQLMVPEVIDKPELSEEQLLSSAQADLDERLRTGFAEAVFSERVSSRTVVRAIVLFGLSVPAGVAVGLYAANNLDVMPAPNGAAIGWFTLVAGYFGARALLGDKRVDRLTKKHIRKHFNKPNFGLGGTEDVFNPSLLYYKKLTA